MQGKQQFCSLLSRSISCAALAALAVTILFALAVAFPPAAQAQTVLYAFAGGTDGASPEGLTMDRAGNLYGTAEYGGSANGYSGNGTVFQLSHKGKGWVLNPLYSFQGGTDGANPTARVIFGPDGSLYGTTTLGGIQGCDSGYSTCGTVFNLKPPLTACKTALCPWTETVLYRFTGGSDGAYPQNGDLFFGQSGILYGTTRLGGAYGDGVVFSLTPSQGAWTYSVIYSFTGGNDGAGPQSGVISDNAGNLYGTAEGGGFFGYGTVYELIPSGSGWQEQTLYAFSSTGQDGYAKDPAGGLIFDASGNLYGTTSENSFEIGGGGVVFELTPSNGTWTFAHGASTLGGMTAGGPCGSLAMDAEGDLYGTAVPSGYGGVFEVPPDWDLTYIGGFSGDNGEYPSCSVILDASGNIYGTAREGGNFSGDCGDEGCGTVWELTP